MFIEAREGGALESGSFSRLASCRRKVVVRCRVRSCDIEEAVFRAVRRSGFAILKADQASNDAIPESKALALYSVGLDVEAERSDAA